MIAAGCVSQLVSSFFGNGSAGSLARGAASRRERRPGTARAFEEYSHYGMVCRYLAGAAAAAVLPAPLVRRQRPPEAQPADPQGLRSLRRPRSIYVVPPVNPDVTIVHAQRADRSGNIQIWGIVGVQAGGGVRGRDRDRRRRGDRRGRRGPLRPEPHRRLRPTRSTPSSSARAARTRPSRRATTTATTPSTASGRRSAATAGRCSAGWRSGCTVPDHADYVDKLGAERLGRARASLLGAQQPVDYGRRR